MKNDSSRNTFDPRKHYSSVRMQQGRVQVDADWNEAGDIITHRVDTEASDVIGPCGGPMHDPAFHIVADVSQLSPEEQKLPENQSAPKVKPPDFLISAGRYYVDGILCENEHITSYLNQPDLPAAVPLKDAGLYLVYVDVWQRHLTALDDQAIREVALGGPDTATRAKTVWQVKYFFAKDVKGNCVTKFPDFDKSIAAGDGKLSARTKNEKSSTNPCIVPPGAGYTGLENQLYRVEVHGAGDAFDVTTGGAGTLVTRVPGTDNQVKFPSGAWKVDDAVEIFSSKVGSDPMNGTLAYITSVDSGSKTLTLDINVSDIALDELRLRPVKATYKWSRNNAFVATGIESINVTDQEITVQDLGPDAVLGFKEGQWVEISDDRLELNGLPGQLIQIAKIDPAINLITLSSKPTALSAKAGGVDKSLHPKLRGWDGIGAIKFHPNVSEDHFLDLESGVQVRFFAGLFKTGDYWTIPARTATADAQSGNIEWPTDAGNKPLAQLSFGIKHHYCRLAMLRWDGTKFDPPEDCCHLFPPITELTSLFYVSGDGQEVMPDLTQPAAFLPLPQQLIVGVANGELPTPNSEVRFQVDATKGNGRVLPNGAPGSFHQVDSKTLDVLTDQDGLARCIWQLDSVTQSQQLKATLQAVTDLNDVTDHPVHLPVIFTANLSIASQVAYNPGDCQPLHEDKTVQKALDRLSHFISLYEVSGNDQEIVPGKALQPLVVLAANRCGAVTDQMLKVHFKIVSGAGKVNGQDEVDVVTDGNGLATCVWALGPTAPNQEVEASLVGDSSHAVAAPTRVRFTSTSRGCGVTVGKLGQFERLDEAIEKLLGEKRADICICLLPGDHLLKDGLKIEGNGVHVKIEGCGRGSRILFSEKPLTASGLVSFTLRDVEVSANQPKATIAFDRCDDITLEDCYLLQEIQNQEQVTPFITISHAKHIRVEDNVIDTFLPIIVNPTPPSKVLAGADPTILELFKVSDRAEFDGRLSEVVSGLARLPVARKGVLAKQLEGSLANIRDLSAGEVKSYNSFIANLTAKQVDESQLRASLADIRLSALRAFPGTAIVFMDAEADTRIEDNNIAGVVSLYGVPGKSSLTQGDMKLISSILTKGAVSISDSLANLQVRDNVMYRIDVSEQTTLLLKDVAAGKSKSIERLYRRCFITDNAFNGVNNNFVMEHLALTSNSFEGSADAGVVIAGAATYVGNYAPNDIRLFNGARANQKAANLGINIVDG